MSNMAFVVKAIFAFALTTFLANNLTNGDFAIWSILISLSLFFTLSDLGAGQYLLRKFVDHRDTGSTDKNKDLISSALVLFLMLAGIFFVFFTTVLHYFQLAPTVSDVSISLFLGLVLARTIFIPYLAMLSAYELFHYRKIIEAGTYLVAFLSVYACYQVFVKLDYILFVYALVFFVAGSAALIICFQNRGIKLGGVSLAVKQIPEIVTASMPYFINNLSLLITRGGLVFLAGFLLVDQEIAQLAVLFTLFYQLVFQFFDIIIRTLQPKMVSDTYTYNKVLKLFYCLLVSFVIISLAVGHVLTQYIYSNIVFSKLALQCFVLVGALEIVFTLFNARWQMFMEYNRLVTQMSLLKAGLYLLLVVVLKLFLENVNLLDFIVGVLFINLFIVVLSIVKQNAVDKRLVSE